MQRGQRADFASAEAVAIENELRSEQENFKARARLIAPALRVRTEMRALINAVSIEARGTEIAALAALPGVKRVELVREFHKLRRITHKCLPLVKSEEQRRVVRELTEHIDSKIEVCQSMAG